MDSGVVRGGILNLSWRKAQGKELNTQCQNIVNQHSDKPYPKAGQVVYHRTDLLNPRAAFKTKPPHLTVGKN
jgi:hypothetical protein